MRKPKALRSALFLGNQCAVLAHDFIDAGSRPRDRARERNRSLASRRTGTT
ncbi:MAG: hypothetical protein IPI67_39500 [Myxococcales bacterium]|nr:hypothetical protein [Myxococcales bacterium]